MNFSPKLVHKEAVILLDIRKKGQDKKSWSKSEWKLYLVSLKYPLSWT
ncbi:hypothetical protein NOC27_1734 [Nitrosococcus oceani AFC27]|nr:hypothetical protein NOC27_1734 [Nitrosococcus oceani AFC27]